MLKDFEKVKETGLEAYQSELNEKIKILQNLLGNYNDGRRKNFFCLAVNVLQLSDIREIMEQITAETRSRDLTVKEMSVIAVRLFQKKADERKMSLKLNQMK